ncbi:MAG: GNAT family N-acetyltransferase [Oscillospiraceae bacterium]|nr:GNAT family N-acetyltransferase [Oscillospiraceae bacterium]
MKIMLASLENSDEIMALYKSLVGTPGCTWDEYYPSSENIAQNIRNNSLYIIKDDCGGIIAAAGAEVERAHINIGCWSKEIKNPCGLFRVAVRGDMHNRRIGETLVRYIKDDLFSKGFDAVILLVSPTNPAAVSLYKKCGFVKRGECSMYDTQWDCYEVMNK